MKEKKRLAEHPSLKKNIKKNAKKAVHKGLVEARSISLNDEKASVASSIDKTLSKLPLKRLTKELEQMESLEKNMKMKKSKRVKKRSHNTTPGQVTGRESPPHHIHTEGKRWVKNITKQTKAKNKILSKKSLKKPR